MKKSKIQGTSKKPYMSQYILKKDNTLPENLSNFFLDLGFDETYFDLNYFLTQETGEKRFVDMNKLQDKRVNLKDTIFDIDVFIGSEVVFLVIRTKKDLQEKIADALFKYAEFVE